jgi:hypothetical protein
MSRFIQSLESRTLFAVTAPTLAADLSAITGDDKAVRTDLTSLQKSAAADQKTLSADLKGSGSANAALLRMLKVDENRALAAIKKDVNSLLKATSLSRKSVNQGQALIKKPTSTSLQKNVSADVNSLNTATTAPLSNLQSDTMGTGVGSDLTAITNANPSNTALATDVATARSDLSTLGTALTTGAQKYSTDVHTLASDLSTLVPI